MKNIYYVIIAALLFISTGCSDDKDSGLAKAVLEKGTVTDERNGETYEWVRYGDLEWTTENLRYYTDSESCGVYVSQEILGEEYDANNQRTLARYGYLYTYQGAIDAVPEGWRLPTDEDWQNLERNLGMKASELNNLEWRGDNLGIQIKKPGEFTDLNLIYGGFYSANSTSFGTKYRLMHAYGFYWTASTDAVRGDEYAYYRKIFYNNDSMYRESTDKT